MVKMPEYKGRPKLALVWTKHYPEAKDSIEDALIASTTMRECLKHIITEQLELLDSQEVSAKDFEDPNWSHRQAFRNGQKRMLYYFKDLIGSIDPR